MSGPDQMRYENFGETSLLLLSLDMHPWDDLADLEPVATRDMLLGNPRISIAATTDRDPRDVLTLLQPSTLVHQYQLWESQIVPA